MPPKQKRKKKDALVEAAETTIGNLSNIFGGERERREGLFPTERQKTKQIPQASLTTELKEEVKPKTAIGRTGRGQEIIFGEAQPLTPEQLSKLTPAPDAPRKQIPLIKQQIEQAQLLAEQRQAGGALAGQVGQIPAQQVLAQNPDFFQAGGAGLAAAIPTAIGGAVTGAIAGGGVLSAPLAAIGAIGGFLVGAKSNLKQQLAQDITAGTVPLQRADRFLRTLITDTNKNPANAAENYFLFNQYLTLLDAEHGRLKIETQRNLNQFLGEDGTVELTRFALFNEAGGLREYYIRQMQIALLNPNPNSNLLTPDDFVLEE